MTLIEEKKLTIETNITQHHCVTCGTVAGDRWAIVTHYVVRHVMWAKIPLADTGRDLDVANIPDKETWQLVVEKERSRYSTPSNLHFVEPGWYVIERGEGDEDREVCRVEIVPFSKYVREKEERIATLLGDVRTLRAFLSTAHAVPGSTS